MATINATLSVTSDITSSGLSISDTMTMTKAGSTTGLEKTTGLARKFLTSTNQVDLLTATSGIAADVPTDKLSSKLYIKNVGSDSAQYFTIGKGNSSGSATETTILSSGTAYYRIGRLYAGEWMIIPWDAVATTGDITIQPSVATEMVVEYMVFFE